MNILCRSRELPWDDPVHYFAYHAVKSIQNRSKSLLLYELKYVVHANDEVWLHEQINDFE